MTEPPTPPPTLREIVAQEFLAAGLPPELVPIFLGMAGILVLGILPPGAAPRPGWVAQLPPTSERLAGAWRGRGSFGHGFGPQTRGHR